jgi:hypothetical protein
MRMLHIQADGLLKQADDSMYAFLTSQSRQFAALKLEVVLQIPVIVYDLHTPTDL